jgi:hypothetical protein
MESMVVDSMDPVAQTLGAARAGKIKFILQIMIMEVTQALGGA